jgi:ferric-chelate reductase
VIAAVVVYAIDHIARIVKTHITTARLHPLPELGITRVEMPSLNAGWRAGQHVRIRVLSSSMGWWGWSEVHPFTIANTTHTPEGVVLMCKKTGRWTSNLFNMAQTFSYGKRGREVGRYVTVAVEGPYGTLSHRRGVQVSDQTFFVLSRRRGTHHDVKLFWSALCCWWERRLFCIISSARSGSSWRGQPHQNH